MCVVGERRTSCLDVDEEEGDADKELEGVLLHGRQVGGEATFRAPLCSFCHGVSYVFEKVGSNLGRWLPQSGVRLGRHWIVVEC